MKTETTMSLLGILVAICFGVASLIQANKALDQAEKALEAAQNQHLLPKLDLVPGEPIIEDLKTLLREVGPEYDRNSARTQGQGRGKDETISSIQAKVAAVARPLFKPYLDLGRLAEQGQLPASFLARAESYRMDLLRDERVLQLLNAVIYDCAELKSYEGAIGRVKSACGTETMDQLAARMKASGYMDRPQMNFDVAELARSLRGS